MNRARTAPPEGGAQGAVAVRLAGVPGTKADPDGGTKPTSRPAPNPSPGDRPRADWSTPERNLMSRVFERCHAAILAACGSSSVPPEFLGALTANESGGNDRAARFEPAVYRHLVAVVSGQARAYGSIHADDLAQSLNKVLHPKADDFHAHFLTPAFGANHLDQLTALEDEALRELATSWGYTQIMGYHMVERRAAVRDLLDPAIHFRVALELLAEFAGHHQLNLASEFAEMFCCWNTGQPYGKTYSPHYVEDGLRRMAIYKELSH